MVNFFVNKLKGSNSEPSFLFSLFKASKYFSMNIHQKISLGIQKRIQKVAFKAETLEVVAIKFAFKEFCTLEEIFR